MARPKRPFHGVERIEPNKDAFLVGLTPGGVGRRQRDRWAAWTHMDYRTPNGLYDPMTYMHVLGALMNINPDIELRSKALAEYLDHARPQFIWDSITVGKVLAQLHEYIEDMLGQKSGLLEDGIDYRGRFYRIHHNGETARLAQALYEDLYRLADLERVERNRGEVPRRIVTPLLECPSVRKVIDISEYDAAV